MNEKEIKEQAKAISFLGTMADKINPPEKTNTYASNDKLLELINVIDERTMDVVANMGNDIARMLINLTSLVEILIEKETITEKEFNEAVHKRALEFRKSIDINNPNADTDLNDIEL